MGSASRNEDMYEPIAIIGLACRYGGDVKNSSELLRHVMKAKSVYGAVPEGRLDARHLYHPATGHIGSIYSNGGYFLKDDINNFDSAFFQLPENDVVAMDPQQKMLLESVYHALENGETSFLNRNIVIFVTFYPFSRNVYEGDCFHNNLCICRQFQQ